MFVSKFQYSGSFLSIPLMGTLLSAPLCSRSSRACFGFFFGLLVSLHLLGLVSRFFLLPIPFVGFRSNLFQQFVVLLFLRLLVVVRCLLLLILTVLYFFLSIVFLVLLRSPGVLSLTVFFASFVLN